MEQINLKPARDGLLVRLEDGSGYLAADGQPVPDSSYYRRRLYDGDVERVEPTPSTAPTRKKGD